MGRNIREIAKEANVSITTVSRIINGDFSSVGPQTRARVEEIIKKNHYVSGKGAKKAQIKNEREQIAVVVPDLQQIFFSSVVDEAERYCVQHGYALRVCSSRGDIEAERRHIDCLIADQVKGVLYMSTESTVENCFDELKNAKLPFVVLDSNLTEYNVPAAAFVDGEVGVHKITRYLIGKGHKKIAYLSGVAHARFNNNRYQGYVRALLEESLTVDPELTVFGHFTYESGQESALRLLQSKKEFTAIVCENDLIALGAIRALERSGLSVPQDVSVVGFDNIYIDEMVTPRLTSLDQHVDQITQKAMEMLIALSCGEYLQDTVVKVTPDLVERGSVRDLNLRDEF